MPITMPYITAKLNVFTILSPLFSNDNRYLLQDCNMPIMDGWQVIFPPVANSKSLFAAATP